MKNPKIAVLVLCTNEKHFLKGVLDSLLVQTYKNIKIYVLDNNSTDGSDKLISNFKFRISNLRYIRFKKNLGYARANNMGLKQAFGAGAGLCLVLNCDTILAKNTIEELIQSYQDKVAKKIKVGLLQPSILIAKNKLKINTLGNAIHYLGFGYCQDLMRNYFPQKTDKKIISVSGAALLISKNYYKDVGSFDEGFFMTAEDQDLSWHGLLFGYQHFLSSKSIVFHHYKFGRHKLNKYREEKNRLMILLKNYSIKTLILFLPIFIATELAILLYSLFEGWFFLKLKTYWVILSNYKHILKNRKKIQSHRIIDDKILLREFVPTIDFFPINNFFTRYLANPVYWLYYRLVSFFI